MRPSSLVRDLAASVALLGVLAATAASAQTPGTRLLVLDQDAHAVSATLGGALFNIDPPAGLNGAPDVEAAADAGAPFSFVSGMAISPFDLRAYVTDLGPTGGTGSVHAVSGVTRMTTNIVSGNPLLGDPFDLAFVPTGAVGRRLVVVDWDSDPSALGPDTVGGLGHGALFWVNEATGVVTLLSDGTLHGTLAGVPAGASAFEDPVGVAYSSVRDVFYVADLSANPLGLTGFAGAVFEVNPVTGAVDLVSTASDFFSLTGVEVKPDGTPLVVDAFLNDSVVWELDITNPDPLTNSDFFTSGTQYALIEGIGVDHLGITYVVDSGEYDSVSGMFIVPPRIFAVDPAEPDPDANGILLNESVELTTPVSVAPVGFELDGVTPATLPIGPGLPSLSTTLNVTGAGLVPGLPLSFGGGATVTAVRYGDAAASGDELDVDATFPGPPCSSVLDLTASHPFRVVKILSGAVTLVRDVGPPCSPRGDANCDTIVDGVDLAILGLAFSTRVCIDMNFANNADFNDNGIIDGVDLAILATYFGTRPMTFRRSARARLPVRVALAALSAAALVAGLLACSGAGDGGTGATGTFLASGGLYTSATPTTTERVFLTQTTSSLSDLCLAVDVGPVVDLFSVAFTLDFDPAVIDYTSFTAAGSFLGTGSQVIVQVTPQPALPQVANRVVVGITRNAADPSVSGGVTGAGGRLMTLCFDLVGPATASPITFTGNVGGWNSLGVAPANQVLTPGEFYGGVLRVN